MLDSTEHYENFPVGSWLVPASLRPAVSAIYRFARHADDLADEGDATPAQRIADLQAMDEALLGLGDSGPDLHSPSVASGESPDEKPLPHGVRLVRELQVHLQRHQLEIAPFRRLLSAFTQDINTKRYPDLPALTDYCTRSADPVGELMLGLFSSSSGRNLKAPPNLDRSNDICTALQWINFLQDMAIDWGKERIYLPLDMAQAAGLDEKALEAVIAQSAAAQGIPRTPEGQALRQAIREFHAAAKASLQAGRSLVHSVPLRLSLELRAICAGGQAILEKLERGGFDPFAARPKLSARDLPLLIKLFFKA